MKANGPGNNANANSSLNLFTFAGLRVAGANSNFLARVACVTLLVVEVCEDFQEKAQLSLHCVFKESFKENEHEQGEERINKIRSGNCKGRERCTF